MRTRRGREDMDGLGVLDTEFPLGEVQQILRETGRDSKRKRKLPASQMVHYVIALGLMASVGARQVLRHLLDQVRENGPVPGPLASEAAITKARQRLGVEPLKELFGRFVRPLAQKWLKSAWYRSWRVVSLDGTTLRVLDTSMHMLWRKTLWHAWSWLDSPKECSAWPIVDSSVMNCGIRQLPQERTCSGA